MDVEGLKAAAVFVPLSRVEETAGVAAGGVIQEPGGGENAPSCRQKKHHMITVTTWLCVCVCVCMTYFPLIVKLL